MPKRIGLVSDVHAAPAPLREALEWFTEQRTDLLLCAGDIAGYFEELDETVELLQQYSVQSISGNHDSQWLHENPGDTSAAGRYLKQLPKTLSLTVEGLQLEMLHAEPPDLEHGGIKLLDVNGNIIPERQEAWSERFADEDADIMIIGHTHQVFAVELAGTQVINPGSSVFNHSCALLELPSRSVTFKALGGTGILKSWNFSMLRRGGTPWPPARS